ncbi:polysaccharide biosynthesis tyrosine autokinase [Vibrio sinensis]|uniref:non-specific protein-tyrosine kinase n=1 Tax=Vibrio sinensis TaxID=2302434 RepID=A0A3A6QD76_9VIBR|nr:polysaccharide biosynthesis tyrosine autokinase [Vibrio sinensis]RJX69712.1 polysaccharide biosynthesis tyrosine autokinase [Vibrio sinensis]
MKLLSKEQSQTESESIDVGKYIVLLKRNWLKIALFTTLVTTIVILFVLSIKPTYIATATLLIESKSTNAISIEEVVGIDSSQQEYYLTQFEILKSRSIAERVISQLNLRQNPEFNRDLAKEQSLTAQIKETIYSLPIFSSENPAEPVSQEALDQKVRHSVLGHFRSRLSINPIRKTQLVRISFESENAQLAADIANAVGEAYINEGLEARLLTTEQASKWISGRMGELQEQLQKSEFALLEFLAREKLVDDSGIDVQASTVINDLILRLSSVTDRRIELESAYSTLRTSKRVSPGDVSTISEISKHPQVINLRSLLAEANKDLTELSKVYGPKHERMQSITAKRANIDQQLRQLLNQLVLGIGKELQAVRVQESLIAKELEKKKSEFQQLTVKKRQYEALVREEETNRNILNVFLNRQKETTATSDFESRNARFTDVAIAPQYPSKPNKRLIVVIGFMAAFLTALSVVLLNDALNNTLTSVKHCEEKLGLIPIGGIPKVKKPKGKKNLDSEIFHNDKFVAFNESIRSARTALSLSNNDSKLFAVSSSLPGEGKTTCAINLALAFSKMERVLLIDCDLRKPTIAERFGHKRFKPGLTNHLVMNTSIEECIFKDEKSGLFVVPSGMPTPNPQELLSSEGFAHLLAKFEERFDRIIIDTPPALVVSDTMIISKLTGKVLIVVKASSTRLATLKNTISRFISHDVRLDGILLNQIREKSSKHEYVYGDYVYESDHKQESANVS